MKILLLLILLIIPAIIIAQETEEENNGSRYKIISLARVDNDSVVLRWMPDKLNVLFYGFEKGYIIEKALIKDNGSVEKYEKITLSPIKRKDDKFWKDNAEKQIGEYEKNLIKMAYSLSFKKDIEKANENADITDRMTEVKNKVDMQFTFIGLSAEFSSVSADWLGLRFTDNNVKEGQSYLYRIYLAEDMNDLEPDTAFVKVRIKKFDPTEFKREIIGSGQDKKIQLKWNIKPVLPGYYIERFNDATKSFERLTKIPIITTQKTLTDSSYASFLDTNIINYKEYKYRVIGISSFAEELYIGEVTAMGRDLTPPYAPVLSTPKQISPKQVKLEWTISEEGLNDLKGFYVGRDSTDKGPFTPLNKNILSPAQREFIDETFDPNGRNFYTVFAVDTANNSSSSFAMYIALIDSTPPSVPNWIKGTMDSNGVVKLILKPQNERDFMGFRILRANDPTHEFSSIIEGFGVDTIDYSKDTVFVDTVSVNTTTRYIYYRAASLDFNYNESDLSEIIAIPRPDIIPPASPLITDVYVSDTSVNLQYVPSFSSDTKYHIIYRTKEGIETADSIFCSGPKDSLFVDIKINPGETYKYFIVAVDSSNLRSNPCIAVIAKTINNFKIPTVLNLRVEFNENKKEPIVKWDYKNLDEEFAFVIYREISNNGLKKYSTEYDKTARIFLDNSVSNITDEIKYAVKVITKSGFESEISEAVKIQLK